MTRSKFLLAAAFLMSVHGLVTPAGAEAVKQTIVLTEVDPTVLATGWRASDIMGAKVYDDVGVEIGKIEDMIITASGTVPYAVVSVGGFLGIDAHHVVVAASALELVDKKLVLHGASKEFAQCAAEFRLRVLT